MPREDKINLVSELREAIDGANALLLTDYRGLTVTQLTILRRKLQDIGSDYRVVKNSLFKLAADESGISEICELLIGPTAVVFISSDDPVAPAKVVVDLMKDYKALDVKGGLVDKQLLNTDQIKALSKIPPRDILLAQLVGTISAPIVNLVGTCQGMMSNLVYTLQAVADKRAA